MRRRWYYWKQTFRGNRPLVYMSLGFFAMLMFFVRNRGRIGESVFEMYRVYGVETAERVMKGWFPAVFGREGGAAGERPVLFAYLEEMEHMPDYANDPAYDRLMAEKSGSSGSDSQSRPGDSGGSDGSSPPGSGAQSGAAVQPGSNAQPGAAVQPGSSAQPGAAVQPGTAPQSGGSVQPGSSAQSGTSAQPDAVSGGGALAGEVIAMKPVGEGIIKEKLSDYDYMMQNFYSVHPTTTAGRDMMNAERFLGMDLSIEKDGENPQILIYHTHSREEFSDYKENPEAVITGVGEYLKELLEQKGYRVIHDTSVYDFKDGKLDRSKAYTYALDGINGILQKYPSIEVVLDIHRDGVAEGTRLVTEIDGRPTAKIMFFNGTSQSPDGPIEYLPNPNREANMAFSFQMQLKAAEKYAGFTRKIYLKGLRYNQHVRARTALIEVGAQTNTYEEARNAMIPLSEILDEVLCKSGDS